MKNKKKAVGKITVFAFFILVIIFSSPVLSSKKIVEDMEIFSESSILTNNDFGNFDPYADDIYDIFSIYYTDGENALGAPDDEFASIFSEYGAGYITLDMGRYEEVLNDTGDDFNVFANGGNYSCWVGNDLSSPFVFLGIVTGNSSFDLSSVGYASARFIRIQYCSGVVIGLDALEAFYFNIPAEDNEIPLISGPSDFWIYDNQDNYNLTWDATDTTPYKYSITVNQEEIVKEYWETETIDFTYFWIDKNLQNVTLVLYDVFGNKGYDTVLIEILDTPTERTGSTIVVSISSILGIIGIASILKKLQNR